MNDKVLQGRIALITGASRGIGRALAKHFVAHGAHVIITARTQGALEELDDEIRAMGGKATVIACDLTDFEAIDKIGDAIRERYQKLDILVANAGMLGTLTPMAHIDPKEWQKVLDVNLTANWRLIRSLDPLLRSSDAGRAIFLTSTVGHEPHANWAAYAVSKAALEMAVRIYAEETTKLPHVSMCVNLIDPGATRTDMRAQAIPEEDPEDVKPPEDINHLFLELASANYKLSGQLISAEDEIEAGHTAYNL